MTKFITEEKFICLCKDTPTFAIDSVARIVTYVGLDSRVDITDCIPNGEKLAREGAGQIKKSGFLLITDVIEELTLRPEVVKKIEEKIRLFKKDKEKGK